MAEPGYSPLTIDKFGGLNTLINPTNLPSFMSPDCPDIEFVPGKIQTRPGTDITLTDPFPNASINYAKTYKMETASDNIRTLVVDSLGNFTKENVSTLQGTLAAVYSDILPNVYCNSVTQFGREYMAMGDGKFGLDIPRQFDDVNFDRVSQEGPGASPVASDENISIAIGAAATGALILGLFTIDAGPTGATQNGNVVTLSRVLGFPPTIQVGDVIRVAGVGVAGYNGDFAVSSLPTLSGGVYTSLQYINTVTGLAASGGGTIDPGEAVYDIGSNFFAIGQLVTVAGVGVAGYNGTFVVRSYFSGTQILVYTGQFLLAASGGGTMSAAGNIVTGTHQLSVIFETRNGYLTRPAPPNSWIASGGKRVIVSKIPTGPPNVIARRLLFTASGGDVFYSQAANSGILTGDMRIPNNSTTTVIVDFSDATLLESQNFDYLFDLVVLGECAGVTEYNSRLVWTGEQNNIQNLLNIAFDGGFSPIGGGFIPNANLPLGWTADPTLFAGGHLAPQQVFGRAYAIIGTGSQNDGNIYQSAYQDYLGNPILQPGQAYLIAARMRKPSGITPATAATAFVTLESVSGGFLYGIQANITTDVLDDRWVRIEAGTPAFPSTIPTDVRLRVYALNMNLGDQVWIDNITISPLANPYNQSLARVSLVEDPESYNGLSGFLQPAEGSGQALNCAFRIRNYLYLAKDRSLYVTADDGQNEPANWEIDEVSSEVGTPSPRGVGLGDEWAIIGSQNAAYFFQGGQISEQNNLTKEIRPTWDSIDWTHGYLLDIKVDTTRKRIYFNAPLSATDRMLLTLDYTEGFGDPMESGGIGRKWSIWTGLSHANSMNLILRDDSIYQFMLGDSNPTSSIFGLNSATLSDANPSSTVTPLPINSYWQSGYFKGDGRVNFSLIDANVTGAGSCLILAREGDQSWSDVIRPWLLSNLGYFNMERKINIESLRAAFRFGTNAVDEYFSMQGFTISAKAAEYAGQRGINVTA